MNRSITRRQTLLCFFGASLRAGTGARRTVRLPLRTRVEVFKGSGIWQEVHFDKDFPVAETAIVICDMWDNHWCKGAAQRVEVLARKMAPVIEQARAGGIRIIHSPSDVMAFYKDYPQRQRMLALPKVEPPKPLDVTDPPLPIDDTQGGCDTDDQFYKAWTRQHAAIRIAGEDAISDNGAEIYSLFRQEGIRNVLVMGVHTNICVLKRSFAIRQMTRWGVHCVLVRDLTDSMYNPKYRPYVPHDQGTGLVVEHIEKYWCPTVLSGELTHALHAPGTVTSGS